MCGYTARIDVTCWIRNATFLYNVCVSYADACVVLLGRMCVLFIGYDVCVAVICLMNGVCVTILRKCFPFGSIHVSGRCLFVCKNKLSVGRGPCLRVLERSKKGEKKTCHIKLVYLSFFRLSFIYIRQRLLLMVTAFRSGRTHLKTLLFSFVHITDGI